MKNELIEKLKDKNYVREFGRMSKEEQECYEQVGRNNCHVYLEDGWNVEQRESWKLHGFSKDYSYAINPNYQPEPEYKDYNKVIKKNNIVKIKDFGYSYTIENGKLTTTNGIYHTNARSLFKVIQIGCVITVEENSNRTVTDTILLNLTDNTVWYVWSGVLIKQPTEQEFIDEEVVYGCKGLGIRYKNDFVKLTDIVGRPDFMNFYSDVSDFCYIENIATLKNQRHKVYARLRKN